MSIFSNTIPGCIGRSLKVCSAFPVFPTAILTFFVWGLVKEGFEAPGQMAIPAIFLLAIFGTALGYLTVFVFQSWPVFIGAAITFAHGARPLFRSEEVDDQTQNP